MRERAITGGGNNVGWASVPSDAHPEQSEDAFFAMPDRGFYGVFDGMGGSAVADVAARIAADEVQEVLVTIAPGVESEVVADALRDALVLADGAIRSEGQAHGAGRGMGTTAAVAVARPKGPEAWGTKENRGAVERGSQNWSVIVGWVGDSRALLVPAGAGTRLQTLTLDDGVVRLHATTAAQAKKVQATLGTVTNARGLTIRERDFFLERNVLIQAVGTSLRHVHVCEHALGSGDQLFLTTDGVHDNLTDREIGGIARRASTAREAAARLVTAARERSRDPEHIRAKPDDMTAIVIRLS